MEGTISNARWRPIRAECYMEGGGRTESVGENQQSTVSDVSSLLAGTITDENPKIISARKKALGMLANIGFEGIDAAAKLFCGSFIEATCFAAGALPCAAIFAHIENNSTSEHNRTPNSSRNLF